MFCGKCGTKIIDGDSYCTNCGAKVNNKKEIRFCYECGEKLDKIGADCDKCNALPLSFFYDEIEEKKGLYNVECDVCNAKFPESINYCVYCGNKLITDEFIFEEDEEEFDFSDSEDENIHNKTDDLNNAKCVSEYDNETDPNEMDYITTNNKERKIEWLVLKKEEDKVLLISKKILYYTSFGTTRYLQNSWLGDGAYETNSQGDWGVSDARKYLNDDLFNTFDDNFRNRILRNVPSKTFEVEEDNLFILSAFEYTKYFGDIDNVENKRIISRDNETNEIKDIWCLEAEYKYDDHMDIITESYNRKYITIDKNNICHMGSESSGFTIRGIRPAMWIKL
ncbi:MAG: zinc ribbon domain-containing protein [Lachnospiraceae bacterium]|nr:zinc ribbon domain-containing protein [Lachnospiraceae bacterium]